MAAFTVDVSGVVFFPVHKSLLCSSSLCRLLLTECLGLDIGIVVDMVRYCSAFNCYRKDMPETREEGFTFHS